jgi:NADH dehydrogenase/NADH:ubiquinone oxidoreductase subunit G
MADIDTAVDVAERAGSPFILYGAGITDKAAARLKKLEGAARYIIVQPGANTAAIAALGIHNGYNPAALKLVYVVLGERSYGGDDPVAGVARDAFIVAQASYRSPLTDRADLVLPSTIWSEQDSTLTNIEGRILNVHKAVGPTGASKPDWEVLQLLSKELGKNIVVTPDKASAEVMKSLQ